MTRAVVGGTFSNLHRGHRILLDRAFSCGDEVIVAITSDRFVQERKGSRASLEERKQGLLSYLEKKGKPCRLVVIDDPYGPSIEDPDLDVIVVSKETESTAKEINVIRVERDLRPLRIVAIGPVLAKDFRPISTRRILEGEIDVEGELLRPLHVGVGSTNPVKLEAVRKVLGRLYGEVIVTGQEVPSGVPSQPSGEEMRKGAMQRAKAALRGNDLGIGIEAGVVQQEDGLYDIQHCAIMDNMGWTTFGQGPGFRYPPMIAEKVRQGMSVGEACDALFHLEKNGHKGGAIGLLTNGFLRRQELTEQAVIASMVPRIRPELYLDQG